MILLSPSLREQITAAAEAAYPAECCGLLTGSGQTVTRTAPSPNVTEENADNRFEVDPGLRFALMRELQKSGERIIGHYHSHPDRPARPSEYDRKMAFEPELAWVIVSVINGKAAGIAAFMADGESNGFREIELQITDSPML